jgi:tetratricopeptide (TPR) repeat protein
MWDPEKFFITLEQARSERKSGQLSLSLAHYESALRMITPDDEGYSQVFLFRKAGLASRAVSEAPNTDRIDSEIRSEMVEILRELHRFEEAYHHATIAHYLDELLHGSNHNNTAASLLDLGLVELERGRTAEAEQWLRKSEEVDILLARSDPGNWWAQRRTLVRAEFKASWGYLAQAADAVLKVLPGIEEMLEPYQIVQHLNSGAQSLQNINEHQLAQQLLTRAIDIQQEAAPDHPQLGRLYSNLSILLLDQLDFMGAKHYAEEATRFQRYNPEKDRAHSLPRILADEQSQMEAWINTSRCHFEEGGERRSYDIALSFNTRDETVVEMLHCALEELGLRTWWFKEDSDWNRPMTDLEIRERVRRAISTSYLVVFVGSNTSFTSQFVLDEVDYSFSVGAPLLVWYPQGVRIQPMEVARRSDSGREHLVTFTEKLLRPGVYAYYGYGLRKPDVKEIAAAIQKRFAALVSGHPVFPLAQKASPSDNVLCPTRLWPVFVDVDGHPIFPKWVQ